MMAEPLPGLSLQLALEPLGLLFRAARQFAVDRDLGVFHRLHARPPGDRNLTRFYTCFALSLWAAMGMALAGNLLTLFVFYEVLTLSTYPLVTHSGTQNRRGAAVDFTSDCCLHLRSVFFSSP